MNIYQVCQQQGDSEIDFGLEVNILEYFRSGNVKYDVLRWRMSEVYLSSYMDQGWFCFFVSDFTREDTGS